MPHLVLEYSANVIEKDKFKVLFAELHALLAQRLPTQLTSCKSRAYEAKDYYLGNGDANNAFVALTISILPGRTLKLLQMITQEILVILQDYFAASLKTLNLQISIEIKDLSKVYLKT